MPRLQRKRVDSHLSDQRPEDGDGTAEWKDRTVTSQSTLCRHNGRTAVILEHGPETCRVRYVNTPMDAVLTVPTAELTEWPAEYDETEAYWDEFIRYERAAKMRRKV
jgi:hypothetical protein